VSGKKSLALSYKFTEVCTLKPTKIKFISFFFANRTVSIRNSFPDYVVYAYPLAIWH